MPTTTSAWTVAGRWLVRQELTGRGVVVVCAALIGTCAWVAVQVGGNLGAFFGLCFVLTCLTGSLAAMERALFTAAVLPPLVLVCAVILVSLVSPDAVAADSVAPGTGALSRTVAGLVGLATALVLGHLAALAVVAARVGARTRSAG